jgi:CelD/BcsL family acetyltransferase involved in cellulose biosynthesis
VSILTSQITGLQVDISDDVADWDALEPEWGELFEASPTASPPLRWEWLRQWWRVYGPVYGGRGLRIVTVRRGVRLIGALPLYLRIGHRSPFGAHRLSFLSTGESRSEATVPDYLDLLHAPGEARACLDAILPALLDPAVGRWDILDLGDIDEGSPLLAWRDQAPRDVRVVVIPRGTCPVADLSGGFEAYLGRLSASGRKQARRMLRAIESTGIRFEVASTPADAAQFFDQLVRLHQARWNSSGRPGCFSAHRFTEFHRTLAELWVPTGKGVLARLARDGEPLAVHYGFINGTKYDQYQSGWDPNVDLRAAGLKSLGIAAHLALMRYLADRGIRGHDFLRGSSEYKDQWSTTCNSLVRLRLVRPGFRAAADEVIVRKFEASLASLRAKRWVAHVRRLVRL